MTPEELKELQIDTIESLKEYIPNLIKGLETASSELKGEMKEDTWEYLRMSIDGLNWVIQAYNGVCDIINPDGSKIDDKVVDEVMQTLGDVYKNKDAAGIAASIDGGVSEFLNKLNVALV